MDVDLRADSGVWQYEMRREMQQVTPGLFVGPSEPSKDLARLHMERITAIIIVRSKHESRIHPKTRLFAASVTSHHTTRAPFLKPRFPNQFAYLILEDVQDNEFQNLIRRYPQAQAFIDDQLTRGGKVLLHDDSGISRAPALAIMYLIDKRNMRYDEAMSHVSARRYCMHINPGFVNQMKEFEVLIRARGSLAPKQNGLTSNSSNARRKREQDDVVEDENVMRPTHRTWEAQANS
ncbi:phosphatases II [Ceraceosorus guamensis]|uniref:Phosphatases II n=1 Tax=Ceraceosorus guamensis TaxID=1522189 RepID=A0A316VQK1_9BASI|nr:phosphatases II [Ceraceosorus guamensis]PWN39338.1 phosphatases II [Ceraceosorus guamensis]